MINRFLAKLETPRRHLAFLVGLLALVFVLTAVVAWRASEAERERAQLAQQTLDQTVERALIDWSRTFLEFVDNSVLPAFGRGLAALAQDPDIGIERLAQLITPARLCADCAHPVQVQTYFSIDPSTGVAESTDAPVSEALARRIVQLVHDGELVRYQRQYDAGILFVEDADTAVMVVVYERRDEPKRLVGFVLPPAVAGEMLNFAYRKARFLPSVLTGNVPDDSIYTRAAYVGALPLLAGPPAGHVASRVIFDTHDEFGSAPVAGLTLSVAARPAAATSLRLGGSGSPRLHMMLLILIIGGLIIVALLQVRRDAELMRLRSEFVAGVTHELRTPLAQIRMFTETLLLGRVRSDVERRRSLEVIDQEARRLAHLVENVLLFSKAEGGRRPRVAPEPTQFAEEIRHAVDSLSLMCRSRSADVRLELQENVTVPVDRMALRQVLINLIDNALKYGPVGQRITVGAALFDDAAHVWVDDEGPGIPVEERARVFDSFYRLPREVQSRVSGSGIGLAVVRELARLHGGNAWAETAPGSGARIVVQFPEAYLRSEDAAGLAAAS